VEILLVTEGRAYLKTVITGEQTDLRKGDSVLVPAAAGAYRLTGNAEIYRAGVPDPA
jgi:mannose-6-phosphate isomerase class I